MPVVLGGDHSIAMGTIAGVSRQLHRERKERHRPHLVRRPRRHATRPRRAPAATSTACPSPSALGIGATSLVDLAGVAARWWTGRGPPSWACATWTVPRRRTSRESGIGAFTMRDIDERGHARGDGGGDQARHLRHRGHPRELRPRRHGSRLRARRGHAVARAASPIARPTSPWRCCRHGQGALRGVRRGEPDPRPPEHHGQAGGGAAGVAASGRRSSSRANGSRRTSRGRTAPAGRCSSTTRYAPS